MGKSTTNPVANTLEELVKLSQEELAQRLLDTEAALQDASTGFETATKELVDTIEELKTEIESLKTGKEAKKEIIIKHNKKSYVVTNPKVRLKNNKVVDANRLEEYPDDVASILAIEGQTILQETK